jgi:hypothetical protein
MKDEGRGDNSHGQGQIPGRRGVGILSTGFVEEIKFKKNARSKCPHCGAELNE